MKRNAPKGRLLISEMVFDQIRWVLSVLQVFNPNSNFLHENNQVEDESRLLQQLYQSYLLFRNSVN